MRIRFIIAIVSLSAFVVCGPTASSQSFALPHQSPEDSPIQPSPFPRSSGGPVSPSESSVAALLRTMRDQAKTQLDMLDLQQKQTEELAREQVKQIMEDAQRQVEQVKQQARRQIEQLEAQKKLLQAQANRQIEELKLQAGLQQNAAAPMSPPSSGFPNTSFGSANSRPQPEKPAAGKKPSAPESGPRPAKMLMDRMERLEKRLEDLEKRLPK